MKQITVVAKDQPGVVADITQLLSDAGVNIETLDAHSVGTSVVARLTVDQYDVALKALSATDFHAVAEDALVLRLDDRPGELARLTRKLKDARIDVRSVRFLRRGEGEGIVALSTDQPEEARKHLEAYRVEGA